MDVFIAISGHGFICNLFTSRVRSNRPEEFYKKKVFLKNFTKFTEKHLRQGLFCNKAADWGPAFSLNTESGRVAFL